MAFNLRSIFFGAGPPRSNWDDLEGTKVSSKILQNILLNELKIKVFTSLIYQKNNSSTTVDLAKWQNRQIDSCCVFRRDDDELILEMSVPHWEALIGQSILFDRDYFVNETNSLYGRFGWFIHSHSLPDQTLKLIFRPYKGEPRKYLPRHLFYMTAVWNKDSVLSQGLLSGSRENPINKMCYCEYDVFLKSWDMDYIRLSAESMYEFGSFNEQFISENLAFLPIIVFRIDTRMFPSGRLPYFEEDGNVFRSYAYVPPAAIDAILYEDVHPQNMAISEQSPAHDQEDSLLNKAKRLAQTILKR